MSEGLGTRSFSVCSIEIRVSRIFWLTFGILCIIEFALFVLTLVYSTKELVPYSKDSLDFALYKTLAEFQDLFKAEFVDSRPALALEQSYYSTLSQPNDWCSLSTCFQDFKVLPTKPRGSAFPLTGLTMWLSVQFSVLIAMWGFHKALLEGDHDTYSCPDPHIRIRDWAGYACSLVSILWWCVDWALLAKPGSEFSTGISILAWVTPFSFLYLMFNHPLGCRLEYRQVTKFALIILCSLLSLTMWMGACFVLSAKSADFQTTADTEYSVYLNDRLPQRYECVMDLFIQAPGNTTCSAEKLCNSRGRLLGDPGVPHLGPEGAMLSFASVIFPLLSLFCFGTSLYSLVRAGIIPIPSRFQDQIPDYSTGTVLAVPFFIFVYLSILVPAFAFAMSSGSGHWSGMNHESAISYDWDCRVVHVSLSPWRQYWDVGFTQGVRIAKAWFNA